MIVDDNHLPVGSDTVGELCLAGDQLTPGYWQNQEKNLTSFFHHDGRRWYLTGDLCMADEEGDIYYIGRKDSQVKIQGYRIELDRKSTRLNSSHANISYAVFCLKKKTSPTP